MCGVRGLMIDDTPFTTRSFSALCSLILSNSESNDAAVTSPSGAVGSNL